MNFKQNKNDIKDKDLKKYSHLWQKALRTSPFMVNEFRKLVKESNKFLKNVDCETLIIRSTRDDIIPYEVGDIIYDNVNSKNKYLTDVKNASHVVLSSDKKEVVSRYIKSFLKGGLKWKVNYKKEI